VVQGLLPDLPADLSAEAQNLSANLNAAMQGTDQTTTGLIELCPACHVEVPLVDITNALCTNGHAWGMFSSYYSCSRVHLSLPLKLDALSLHSYLPLRWYERA